MNELGSKDWRVEQPVTVSDAASVEAPKAAPKKRRHLPRAARRQQLIEATIDSISKRGFAETTLSHVAKTAGLSQGIVNLHFESKDSLFVETLKHLRDEFRSIWMKKLKDAGDDPAKQIRSLMSVYFDRRISSKKKMAGWFAFIGETRSRPVYRKICEDHDSEYFFALVAACKRLIEAGGYDELNANDVAGGLEAMVEGLWLSIYLSPDGMNRDRAREVSDVFLAKFFPRHFPMAQA